MLVIPNGRMVSPQPAGPRAYPVGTHAMRPPSTSTVVAVTKDGRGGQERDDLGHLVRVPSRPSGLDVDRAHHGLVTVRGGIAQRVLPAADEDDQVPVPG